MKTSKQFFVTGITGNQGSAVAKHLLASGHSVVGLTRDTNSEKAKHWKEQGVTLVKGDLDDPSSFRAEMSASDGVFFVQSLQKKNGEIEQGKRFIDSAKEWKTRHLVYSSVLGADLNTGVPHFESKYELEKLIKSSGLDHTVLRPASFYENCLFPQVANGIRKGNFVSPLKASCRQQMIGVDDIGKIAVKVMSNPKKYIGKTLSIATDEHLIGDLPKVFSTAIQRPVKYKKLPGIFALLFMGRDLYKMFGYMNRNGFSIVDDVQQVRDEFDIEGNFESWTREHFKAQ